MTHKRKNKDQITGVITDTGVDSDSVSLKYQRLVRILRFFMGEFRWNLFALVFFSILLGLMETLQVVLIYPILTASFDLQSPGISFFEPLYGFVRNVTNLPDVIAFSLIFLIFVFLTFFVTLIYKYLSLILTKDVITKTKGSIFDKLVKNDYRYFIDNTRGNIMYAVISAPDRVKQFFDYATSLFSDSVVILVVFSMLFFVSTSGFMLMLVGGFLFIIIVRFFGKRAGYRLGKLQLTSIQSENEIINGYIQGLRQIRSVSGDTYWQEKYNRALNNYWTKFIKYNFLKHLPSSIIQFFFFSSIAIIVIIIYFFYQERFIYIIPLIGTFAFSGIKILPRLSSSSNNYMNLMDAWPNLETIYAFLNDSRYNTMKNGIKRFETLSSDIFFDDVSFSYNQHRKIIDRVSLTIAKNKITALVGHSGSGKSTIVSLALRYYDVSDGSIRINGIDLREYDIKTLLNKVGYVSQDTFIYNASVRENISFGGNYSDEKIVEAAKKANIHTYIASLPNGYESIVGDQGLKLSGGEKQRLAIARALVRDPEILILDEATSNLDNESEEIVQESINRVSETITTFIIAHRLSTIRKADVIFVISEGRIVESGCHDELMDKRGIYYELYESGE
jgi:ATP-binding cassette, subfamily B, bacterial